MRNALRTLTGYSLVAVSAWMCGCQTARNTIPVATTKAQSPAPTAPAQISTLATAQPQPSTHVNHPAFDSDLSSITLPPSTNNSPAVSPVAASQTVAAFESENYAPDKSNTQIANFPPQPEATRNAPAVTSPALTSQDLPWEAPPQSHATPTPAEPTPAIVLQIDNVRPNQGKVKVAVFTDPESFLVKGRATTTLDLADATQVVTAQVDIKQPCAIAVFQDIDGDGELTRNRRGIPIEPCGFSNNAIINRGPPKFADAAVNPGSDSPTKVLIRLP